MEIKDSDCAAFLLSRGWLEIQVEGRITGKDWKEVYFTFPEQAREDVELWQEATGGRFTQSRKRIQALLKAHL